MSKKSFDYEGDGDGYISVPSIGTPPAPPETSESGAMTAQFFVSKHDQEFGPYDESQILAMLQTGELAKKDLCFYEGLGDWQPIEDVFEIQEQLIHFMDEGQEAEVVVQVYNILSEMLSGDEEIYYIAHQRKKFLRAHRDVVAVTNRRLLALTYHLTSHDVDDYLWSSVVSVHAKEGLMGNVFAVRLANDRVVEVDDLPHAQIAKLVQLAQEMRVE